MPCVLRAIDTARVGVLGTYGWWSYAGQALGSSCSCVKMAELVCTSRSNTMMCKKKQEDSALKEQVMHKQRIRRENGGGGGGVIGVYGGLRRFPQKRCSAPAPPTYKEYKPVPIMYFPTFAVHLNKGHASIYINVSTTNTHESPFHLPRPFSIHNLLTSFLSHSTSITFTLC